jgi:hypothetical protein
MKGKNEGLSKNFLGGKWEEVKMCFSFSFHWPPSIGTFPWPLSWDLPSPPSLSFFLKR